MMSKITSQEAMQAWHNYVNARRNLLKVGLVRSFKQPESDFAEWLVARLFDGELSASKSNAYFDVRAGERRIQVKSLSKASDNANGYIIKPEDRGQPSGGATHYAFVFFDEMMPSAIFLVPTDFVKGFRKTQIKRTDLEQRDDSIEIDFYTLLQEPRA